MTLYGTPPDIYRPPFVNACTVCDVKPKTNALFCKACGNMTTRDPDKVPAKVCQTKLQRWAQTMRAHRAWQASQTENSPTEARP